MLLNTCIYTTRRARNRNEAEINQSINQMDFFLNSRLSELLKKTSTNRRNRGKIYNLPGQVQASH